MKQLYKYLLVFVICYLSVSNIYSQMPKSAFQKQGNYFNQCLLEDRVLHYAKTVYISYDFQLNDTLNLILDSLFTGNDKYKMFYFNVLTKLFPKADGAYGELLVHESKRFVENNPVIFFQFLARDKTLPIDAINSWSDMVCAEIMFVKENEDKRIMNEFIDKLNTVAIRDTAIKNLKMKFTRNLQKGCK